jgi:carboxypeptidase family protein
MRRFIQVALLTLSWVLVASLAQAQRLDGTLRVTVTDKTGGTVEGARVTVTNEATNVSTTATASSAGTYVFPSLLVGSYRVTVEKDGFKKSVSKGVAVESNQVAEATALLEIGDVSAVVEVEAGAEVVKVESSELSATFSGRVANELPLGTLGGDVKELAVLAPNTTSQPGGVLGSGGSVGGGRPRFNGFSVDGVDDNRQDVNGPIQPVIQESVAEFTLLTNQFSAEYGHSAAGQFNTVTKSGTNNWHGSGWEYNRNRKYNAADNQQRQRFEQALAAGQRPSDARDRFDYNRAGASAGGPILKNRLFIFGAYEFQNNGLAASSPSVILPTAAGLATLQGLAADQQVKDLLSQFPTAPGQDACNPGPCTTLVNGQNIPVGTFQAIAPIFTNQHDFIVNTDLVLGTHRLSGRFLFDRFRAPDFNQFQPQSQFLGTNASDARKVILADAWTVSSSIVNDLHAAYSRLNGPNLVVPTNFKTFPNVEIDGLGINTGPESLAPQGYGQNLYQLSDAMTLIKGKNTVKFGVEYREWISPTVNLPRARGEWDYANFQQFINDEVPTGLNGALKNVGSGSFSANAYGIYGFVQDDVKVTPRLVLNLGLRYEFNSVPRDEALQALDAIADDPARGLFFRAPKADKNNFAPRFGFAWDPRGNGKWAVRGGAGYAYDVTPVNFASNQPPPQFQFENNPNLTCQIAPTTAWCPSFNNPSDGTGKGFLAGGGLSPFISPSDQATARAITQGLNVDVTEPKILTWTLSVQHEVAKNTAVEVRYLGTHAVSLPVQKRLNEMSAFDPAFPGGALTPLPTYLSASAVPAQVPVTSERRSAFVNVENNGLFQPLAADGFFSVFTTFPPIGQSIYHAGSVDIIHRFNRGLYFRANYTFAKNIDNATNELFSSRVNPRRSQDANNFRDERGRSALDINHKLAISFVYDLPQLNVQNAFAKGALHGWEFTGFYIAQTGQPVTVLSGTDSNANGNSAGDRAILNSAGQGLTGSGVNFVCVDGAGNTSVSETTALCGGSANIVGYALAPPTIGPNTGIVTPNARFVQAGLGAKANVGRNTVGTPGLNIWNLALIKNTKISERFGVQFRLETFDTFNHRNFSLGLPSNNGAVDQVTNPNPLSTTYTFVTAGPTAFLNAHQFNGGSRTMELGLKLTW